MAEKTTTDPDFDEKADVGRRLPRGLRRALGLFRSFDGTAGLILCALLVLAGILAPVLSPYDPFSLVAKPFLAPSSTHLIGTDELGRDLFSRILYGARLSLIVGLGSAVFGILFGVGLGVLAGYLGGVLDTLITRAVDVLLSFPGLILALLVNAILGSNLPNTVLALGIVSVPRFARVIRGQVLSLKQKEFVEALRVLGAGPVRVIGAHILPRLSALIVVELSLTMAFAMMTEASLSFLGLGVGPPHASWGMILKAGYPYLETAPWIAICSASALFLGVMGFTFLADGVRRVAIGSR